MCGDRCCFRVSFVSGFFYSDKETSLNPSQGGKPHREINKTYSKKLSFHMRHHASCTKQLTLHLFSCSLGLGGFSLLFPMREHHRRSPIKGIVHSPYRFRIHTSCP